jgi:Icc-related predicted phosphoesterase
LTKLVLLSDLHGELPDVEELPEADIYLIAGDICEDFRGDKSRDQKQSKWLQRKFTEWLYYIPGDNIVGVAGNHDFVFEKSFLVPEMPWIYLQDETVEVCGLNIYGSPWGNYPNRHAFGVSDRELEYRATQIPLSTDILLLHQPPAVASGTWPSDKYIDDRLLSINPKLVVCGHIHEEAGVYDFAGIPVVNASLTDKHDNPDNEPIVWEL